MKHPILTLLLFLAAGVLSAQVNPPAPTPSALDREATQKFFLGLLSRYEAVEKKGDLSAVETIYYLEKARPKTRSVGSRKRLEGKITPSGRKGEVLVRYPELGLVSRHFLSEEGETFYLNWGCGGNQTYTEMASGPKYGERNEGLFLIYADGQLWHISTNLQVPKTNFEEWLAQDWVQQRKYLSSLREHPIGRGGLIIHNGSSLTWDQQPYMNDIRYGQPPDEMGSQSWTAYWANGKVKCKGTTQGQREKRTGTWEYFYPSGEKWAKFTYGENSHIVGYQGWYEGGVPFCDGISRADNFDSTNFIRMLGNATEHYFAKDGKLLYETSGSSEKEGDPLAVLYWPNGNPALKSYPTSGICQTFHFELLDPSGKVFFSAQRQVDPEGCSDKILATGTEPVSVLPDVSVTLGVWAIGGIIEDQGIFLPVITATLKDGKLEGQLLVGASSDDDDPGNVFNRPFYGIFSFRSGKLDGKSVVGGIGIHRYQFKLGKLEKEEVFMEKQLPRKDYIQYLRDVLSGAVQSEQMSDE